MLFHLGTLWRLHELGRLHFLDLISSVSENSITAAVLACADMAAELRTGDGGH